MVKFIKKKGLRKMDKSITDLIQVTEPNVKYWLTRDGIKTGQWVKIETDDLGYGPCFTLFRKIYQSQLYSFETKGDYVRSWKTFNGALRFAIKHYSSQIK